jgi:hypothetical protein
LEIPFQSIVNRWRAAKDLEYNNNPIIGSPSSMTEGLNVGHESMGWTSQAA